MKRRSPADASGFTLKPGDEVRVIGIPDLRGVSPAGRRESLPAFRHLVGTYPRIAAFDRYGNAELWFRIRRGRHRRLHRVAIEPHLLRRRHRAAPAGPRSRRYSPGRSSTGGGS